MSSKVLFPTTIWTHAFIDLQPMLPDWIQRLNEMRAREQEGKGRSTRSGWSGPKTLFEDPAFQPLLIQCQQAFKAALREMGVPDGFSFAMEAWGNIHDPGGFNLPHIHREALLSGSFYLYTPRKVVRSCSMTQDRERYIPDLGVEVPIAGQKLGFR